MIQVVQNVETNHDLMIQMILKITQMVQMMKKMMVQ